MNKVIVTGGAGFIGSNLALALQAMGMHVIIIDDFSKGRDSNLSGFRGEVIPENILDVYWEKFGDVEAIFHQAAITDTTVQDEYIMNQTNVEGFKRVLDFAVRNGIRFIYASSAGVYGASPAPQKEPLAGKPVNIYGWSKWEDDCLAEQYMRDAEAPVIGLRYFNVFGPNEAHKGKMASMVWQLAVRMAAKQQPRIFKWGEQSRDQVYVKDVVNANILALQAQSSFIVNVGSGKPVSFNQIVEELNTVLGTDYQPEYVDNPHKGVYQEYTQADLTGAGSLLGYHPDWLFKDAVRDYIRAGNLELSRALMR